MKKLLNAAFAYGVAGIVMGVVFREATKFLHYTAPTALGRVLAPTARMSRSKLDWASFSTCPGRRWTC